MIARIQNNRLQVAPSLYTFIEEEVLPGTGIESAAFWRGFDALVHEMAPKNRALLAERERLQAALDLWHQKHPGSISDMPAYKDFLKSIGYLRPVPENVQITPTNIDSEVSLQGGPQLVAPLTNDRFVVNAANARWQSLYDALYTSDVISEEDGATRGGQYNPVRGDKVIAFCRDLLDQIIPLTKGSHRDAKHYALHKDKVIVTLSNGDTVELKQPELFAGYNLVSDDAFSLLFRHNELHLDVKIDRNSMIGKQDPAGISDIIIESATTTIMDLEDAVAAVDADDKIIGYRNWLELMKGTLTCNIEQGGKTITRHLNADRTYTAVGGGTMTLHGRSLLFVRNVGHLMTCPAVLDGNGNEIPEGILDAVVTTLIAMHDLKSRKNSRAGSIYVVKPKMHGPDEAAFTDETFSRVEQMLGLPQYTVKIGIMDEERRTSVNLKACVAATSNRLAFINTGFLDRTGDEMRTSMEAGPVIRKADMRRTKWIAAYEVNNMQVGLQTGMRDRAQIGKGMWAMPDLMADMLKQKIAHLQAGANTAWVPSPTAAAIHAIHYHQINVRDVQRSMEGKYVDILDDLLTIPVTDNPNWSPEEIQQELDNNAQGILGYVVRWVDHGVGCSKVPDIHDVALMEDRATLRISSLHIANWLRHGITNETQVMNTLKRMAAVVDRQNENDQLYRKMVDNFDHSPGFKAACDLIFKARSQPSGYTEPLLHAWRQRAKSMPVQMAELMTEPVELRKAS
ncbi:MAG: malate synthase G [Oxalobacter sp.]|nr:MAG: malate synthase G [Oxalobacter sp.]